MAVSWQSESIIRPLSHNQRGNKVTYQCTFRVKVSEPCAGYVAQTVSQQNASSAVPSYGDALYFGDGGTVGYGSTSYADAGAFALDFSATPIDDKMEARHWDIAVTWRQPDPGTPGGELPGHFNKLPLSRPREHWIEYEYREEERTRGRHVKYDAESEKWVVGKDAAMRNSAGSPLPPVLIDRIVPVLVAAWNVKSPAVGLDMNLRFENTSNNADWRAAIRTGDEVWYWNVPAWHSRFRKAETGPPLYERGQAFHRLELRIEVAFEPFFIERLDEGYVFLTQPKSEYDDPPTNFGPTQHINSLGVPSWEKELLNGKGERYYGGAAGPADEYYLKFLTLRGADYSVFGNG